MRLTLKAGRIVVFDIAILDEIDDEDVDDGDTTSHVERRLGSDSTLADGGEVEPPAYPMDRANLGFR